MSSSTAPRVSVITPVFDRAPMLAKAVRSVLAQGADVEHILVDDGSTDGTLGVLEDLARADQRVRVLAAEHGGPSAARNRALEVARASFVTFLDSDDLMPAGRIDRQLEYLATHADVDAVLGVQQFDFAGGVAPPAWTQVPMIGPRFYWLTVLVGRDEIRRVGGFDESLWYGEDTDLSVRLQAGGVRMRGLDEVFVIRRFFGDNLTYERAMPSQGLLDSVRRHLHRDDP